MMRAADDDEYLVALAQSGDRAAFDELAERHCTRLRRVLFRTTHDCDAADDAVQEALLRAWKNIGRFEGRSQFSTWLTRIGINEAYRGLRRPVEETLELTDQVGERIPSWGARPPEIAESREFLAAVEQALAELPAGPPRRRGAARRRGPQHHGGRGGAWHRRACTKEPCPSREIGAARQARRLLQKRVRMTPRFDPTRRHHEHCRHVRAQMSDYIDDDLDATAAAGVTRHTRFCPNCQRMLANLTRTVAGLRALHDLDSRGDDAHPSS